VATILRRSSGQALRPFGRLTAGKLRTGPSAGLRTGVEQLTYLLFLKMADERTKAPYNQPSPIPEKYSWQCLLRKDGDELFDHYRHSLEKLYNEKGLPRT
jgi:hypothetical protein